MYVYTSGMILDLEDSLIEESDGTGNTPLHHAGKYICICIYGYTYICIYVCMYICRSIYSSMYICVYIYVYMSDGTGNTPLHHAGEYIYVYVCMGIHTSI
jgi:hypothetical protein